MNKFVKQLLTGVAALGLMAPVATSSLDQVHASHYSYGLNHNLVTHAINNGYIYGPTKRFTLVYKHNRFTIKSNQRHGGGTIIALNGNYRASRSQITSALKGRRIRNVRRRARRIRRRRPVRHHARKHVKKREPLYMWYKQNAARIDKKYARKNKYYDEGSEDAGNNAGFGTTFQSRLYNNKYYKLGWITIVGSQSFASVVQNGDADGSALDYKHAVQDYNKVPAFLKKHGNPPLLYIVIDHWHVDHDATDENIDL